jgi:TolB-like protein/Flp pilus assembly protein TadD
MTAPQQEDLIFCSSGIHPHNFLSPRYYFGEVCKVFKEALNFFSIIFLNKLSRRHQGDLGMANTHFYEFGPYRLNSVKRLLLRDGQLIPMPPKLLEMLLVLVQRSGQVVEKDEFMRLLWSDAFVEESNLSQNVFMLRKILGKDPNGQQYIETVPKRGYTFTSPVRETQEQSANVGVNRHAVERDVPEVAETTKQDKSITSLAVLPLFNVNGDPEADYLSEGITESVVNRLSQISSLQVMACSTVFRYKGQEVHPQEIGRELGVQAVAVGRILSLDESFVIRMELVEVANGWQLWGEQYDSQLSDLLQIQKEIAQNITNNMRLRLTTEEQKRIFDFYTRNEEAHHLYLKGRYFLNKRTEEGYANAIESFQQAINIDSNYALAYSGLADSYIQFDFYGLKSPWQLVPIARAAAIRAIELDETLAEAQTSVAHIKLIYDRDLAGAETDFKRAIEMNPSYAQAHNGYAHCLIELDRIEEAFAESKRALELDPFNLDINLYLGWHYLHTMRHQEAIEQLRKTLELGPNFYRARLLLGMAYGQTNQFSLAIAEYKKAALLEDSSIMPGFLGQAYALTGKREEALNLLAELLGRAKQSYVPPFAIALIYIGLGQRDEGFQWLEKAAIENSQWQAWLEIIPEFGTLRSDPRFAHLLQIIRFQP